MNREEIFLIIKNHRAELEQYGVDALAVFGSLARGDDHAQSDIDLLVEFNRPVGLFQFVRLKLYLEELVGRPVDLVTIDALKPALKERILQEMIYVR
jgi:uncharacterized protein